MRRVGACGHEIEATRGPLGFCDACRPLRDIAMRLRQAALAAAADGHTALAAELGAMAEDPRAAIAAAAAREAEAAAAQEVAPAVEPSSPPRASSRIAAEDWGSRAGLGPRRSIDEMRW
jgi:hypothetical protein